MFEASKEFLELTFREEEARGNYPARGPGPCPVAENVRSARTGRRAVKWVGLLSQSSLKLRAAWCPILAPIQIELVACRFGLAEELACRFVHLVQLRNEKVVQIVILRVRGIASQRVTIDENIILPTSKGAAGTY